jgi:hypothetical protein
MASVLTPLQRELLARLNRTSLAREFFLTGGTALAECYLHHRLSEDLDFFTEVPGAVPRARPEIEACARDLGAVPVFTRAFESFLECRMEHPDGPVLMQFAQDSPYRLKPVVRDHAVGFPVDNSTDISCNKLAALFDRAAGKDFVDVFFINAELIPLPELIALAGQKHVGLDAYWLSRAFLRVEKVEQLPRMLKPLDLDELKAFFLGEAKRLMDSVQTGG